MDEYTKENLKIDLEWFGSFGVDEETAKDYIMFLLNSKWVGDEK